MAAADWLTPQRADCRAHLSKSAWSPGDTSRPHQCRDSSSTHQVRLAPGGTACARDDKIPACRAFSTSKSPTIGPNYDLSFVALFFPDRTTGSVYFFWPGGQ